LSKCRISYPYEPMKISSQLSLLIETLVLYSMTTNKILHLNFCYCKNHPAGITVMFYHNLTHLILCTYVKNSVYYNKLKMPLILKESKRVNLTPSELGLCPLRCCPTINWFIISRRAVQITVFK